MSIKLIEEQTNNPSGTAEEIIVATRENVIKNQNELEEMGKDINIEEISNEENGEQVDVYFYVIVDEDIYKVELEGVKFIGRKDEFPPIIRITGVTSTTDTITVTVETQRNEEGKIEYWIKAEDEEEYRKIGETEGEEKSYTYEGLTQNKKYNIKVIAIAKNKKTAETTANGTTGNVPDLTDADITFAYDPAEWTKGSVEVTASANIDITGYTLKLSTDLNTWSDSVTRTENGKVYAKLSDNTNQYGDKYATGNVTNIDTAEPTIGSATGSTATGNTGTITVSNIVDTGGSGLKGYYISTSSTTPTSGSVTWTPNTASSFTKTVSTNGTYYVWVIDNVGNVSSVKSCKVSGIVSKVSITAYKGLTIVAGNTGTPTLTYTGTPKSKTFSSSNTSIATINSSTGVVTGKSVGAVTMTVKLTNYDNTSVTATCVVYVNQYIDMNQTDIYAFGETHFQGWENGGLMIGNKTAGENSRIVYRKVIDFANVSAVDIELIELSSSSANIAWFQGFVSKGNSKDEEWICRIDTSNEYMTSGILRIDTRAYNGMGYLGWNLLCGYDASEGSVKANVKSVLLCR